MPSFVSLFPGFSQHTEHVRTSDTLKEERVRLLYSNLPSSVGISALLLVLIIFVFNSVIAHERLYGWSALLGVVLFGRALFHLYWKKYRSGAAKQLDWLFWFRLGAIITGVLWGVGGVVLTPQESLSHKIYISFAVGGLSAGAAITMAVDRVCVNSYLFSVLVPHIVFLLTVGDKMSLGMATMMTLFLLFLLPSAKQLRLQFEENCNLRHQAIESALRFRQMLESSPIAARIADAETNQVLFANSSYMTLIDTTPDQILSIVTTAYYPNTDVYADMMRKLCHGKQVTNELVELCSPDGNSWVKWVLASYIAVEYENKSAVLGWFYDITDRKIMEEEVEKMAYYDVLTGLPNRSLFFDRLKQALIKADREKRLVGLLFLDLDKFKPVNDQYGHHVGDVLLKAVSERICGCLRRKTDSVARIGGDEFVILLPTLATIEDGVKIGEKIREELNQPFVVDGKTLDVSSSIGMSVYPTHADDEHDLIKTADIAMYYAKADGRNRINVYYEAMVR